MKLNAYDKRESQPLNKKLERQRAWPEAFVTAQNKWQGTKVDFLRNYDRPSTTL